MVRYVMLVVLLAVTRMGLAAGDGSTLRGTLTLEVDPAAPAPTDAHAIVWIDGPVVKGEDRPKLVIAQKNSKYEPNFGVALVGQEVSMPNLDTVAHNAFSSTDGNEFDLGIYPKGKTKSVRFAKTGIVDVRCRMHSRMSCTILVVPTPHFAVMKPAESNSPRSFAIEKLPPGTYTLHVWQYGFTEKTIPVEVSGAETALDLTLTQSAPGTSGALAHAGT